MVMKSGESWRLVCAGFCARSTVRNVCSISSIKQQMACEHMRYWWKQTTMKNQVDDCGFHQGIPSCTFDFSVRVWRQNAGGYNQNLMRDLGQSLRHSWSTSMRRSRPSRPLGDGAARVCRVSPRARTTQDPRSVCRLQTPRERGRFCESRRR